MRPRYLLTLIPLLASCDDPIPPSPWADVAGIHQGSILGLALPLRIVGIMSLDIVQADSALSGTFVYDVMIDPAGERERLVGRGTLDGTIGQGPLPAIRLEFEDVEECEPLLRNSTLVGEHIIKSKRTNLRGNLRVVSEDCDFGGGHMISISLAHAG